MDSVLVTDKPEAMMNRRIACEVGFSVSPITQGQGAGEVTGNPVFAGRWPAGYADCMNAGLQVAYLWHDIDALELRITAQNAEFRGTADAA